MNFAIQGSFRGGDFGDAVVVAIPELRQDMEEWTGLVALQIMELRLFAEKEAAAGNTKNVGRCVELLHRALIEGDAELKNLVHVAFLEHVNPSDEVGKRLYDALTPELQAGWKDINDYLDKLLNRTPASID